VGQPDERTGPLGISNVIQSAEHLIERIVFEVASHRGLTDDYVVAHPASWLLSQYDQVLRARWAEVQGIASATELGVTRAIIPMLSKKKPKLPNFPTFDEVMAAARKRAPRGKRTKFQKSFEAQNAFLLTRVHLVRPETRGRTGKDSTDDD
jgi:hypothetical protein